MITGTFFGDPRTGWLLERDVPFVSFGRPWGGDDVYRSAHTWVDVDGAAGTRAATRHALASAGRARRASSAGRPAAAPATTASAAGARR